MVAESVSVAHASAAKKNKQFKEKRSNEDKLLNFAGRERRQVANAFC
jgi:hypothetical protein